MLTPDCQLSLVLGRVELLVNDLLLRPVSYSVGILYL